LLAVDSNRSTPLWSAHGRLLLLDLRTGGIWSGEDVVRGLDIGEGGRGTRVFKVPIVILRWTSGMGWAVSCIYCA
jgi:hypothetical protein